MGNGNHCKERRVREGREKHGRGVVEIKKVRLKTDVRRQILKGKRGRKIIRTMCRGHKRASAVQLVSSMAHRDIPILSAEAFAVPSAT